MKVNYKPEKHSGGMKRPGWDRYYAAMQPVAGLLLLAGFAGPWIYGPLGKSADWGWQPVWGVLLSLVGVNLFILIAIASCFSYVELNYRQGRPPLGALLKWIAGFVVLVAVVPGLTWLLVDLSDRSRQPRQSDGAPGWGIWLALAGQIIQVTALRLQIRGLKTAPPEEILPGAPPDGIG